MVPFSQFIYLHALTNSQNWHRYWFVLLTDHLAGLRFLLFTGELAKWKLFGKTCVSEFVRF